jgi:parafibromin
VARPAPSGAFSAAGSAARPPTAGRTATSAPLQGAPRPVGSSAPPQPSATKHLARPPSHSTVSPAAARPSAFPGLRPGVTILIVPSAITSIVSMYNVRPLLEASEFTPGAELKAKEGFVKETSFLVSHTFEDGTKLELLVIDNPAKLQPHEWAQVGACIAQGSTWQFKGWPFPQGEVEIFAKMCGFYIRHSDEIPNQKTKGWTVTNLVFSREKSRRHEVGVIMTTFWVTLQKFLKIHKGNLLHNARSSRV